MISQAIEKPLFWFVAVLWLALGGTSVQAHPLPDFTKLVEDVRSAVVNVSAESATPERGGLEIPDDLPYDELLRRFFGDGEGGVPRFERDSQGSGFILSADGYVLTNHHVVAEAGRIVVRLSDRREFDAKLIGSDKRSDIALLKIEADRLPVVNIGDSNKLKEGEWVVAIGSPFGFEYSVTAGIVSAKGRTLPNENYVPFIQTDVAINPGNSGGPLFNLQGEVVGINSQIFSRTGGYMGLSFAIPMNMAIEVAEQLKSTGRVSRGWLGVYIQDVTRDLAESFGMAKPEGALVARVLKDSPAEKAGIEIGDVIIEFDGKPIGLSASLPPIVGRTPLNRSVPVKIVRGGQERTLSVKLTELPEELELSGKPEDVEPRGTYNKRLGIAVGGLTQEEREKLELGEYGLLVRRVDPQGPAAEAGLIEGDVIVMINGVKLEDVRAFTRVVGGLKAGQSVAVLVHRDNAPIFLALKLPAE